MYVYMLCIIIIQKKVKGGESEDVTGAWVAVYPTAKNANFAKTKVIKNHA